MRLTSFLIRSPKASRMFATVFRSAHCTMRRLTVPFWDCALTALSRFAQTFAANAMVQRLCMRFRHFTELGSSCLGQKLSDQILRCLKYAIGNSGKVVHVFKVCEFARGPLVNHAMEPAGGCSDDLLSCPQLIANALASEGIARAVQDSVLPPMAVEEFAGFAAGAFRPRPRYDVCAGALGHGPPTILYSVVRSMTKR